MTFVTFQISSTAEETVESKHAFKRFALSHGVSIRKYRANNGSLNTRVFKEAITAANQCIDFCAAYTHHQNSIVECMIQTITFWACSQLIHAMYHWLDIITAKFWPYPIRLVVNVHNNSLSSNGLSPCWTFHGALNGALILHFYIRSAALLLFLISLIVPEATHRNGIHDRNRVFISGFLPNMPVTLASSLIRPLDMSHRSIMLSMTTISQV